MMVVLLRSCGGHMSNYDLVALAAVRVRTVVDNDESASMGERSKR